jgi:alcohol dehydrogenase, propanol-preferring
MLLKESAQCKKSAPPALGPHAVILVAVNGKPFQQAAEYDRPRGTVTVIGLPAGAKIQAPTFELVLKMVRIQCSFVSNRQDSEEAIDFSAKD